MAHDTPSYVTAGLSVLDALWAERYEGGMDLHARTSNNGGEHVVTDVFELRPYCWCEGDAPGHQDGCPPNFLHKPSGFAAHWYKHASRGAQCSEPVSAERWADMLVECIHAVTARPQPYVVLITGSREYGRDLQSNERGRSFREDWATVPSAQRDAMVAAFRGARERAGSRPLVIRHGCAKGADSLAGLLAERSGCATEEWPALWRREDGTLRGGYDRAEALRVRSVYAPGKGYYSKAGPERNQAMVDAGADECLAFKAVGAGNRGTQHCIDAAVAAGIPVTVTEA
jgi:hypothetical protein